MLALIESEKNDEVGDGGGEKGGQGPPLHTEEPQPGEGGAPVDPPHHLLHPHHLPRDSRVNPS